MRHEHAFLPAEPYLLSIVSRNTGVKGLGVGEGDERVRVIMGEGVDQEGRRRHIGIAADGDRADGNMVMGCRPSNMVGYPVRTNPRHLQSTSDLQICGLSATFALFFAAVKGS